MEEEFPSQIQIYREFVSLVIKDGKKLTNSVKRKIQQTLFNMYQLMNQLVIQNQSQEIQNKQQLEDWLTDVFSKINVLLFKNIKLLGIKINLTPNQSHRDQNYSYLQSLQIFKAYLNVNWFVQLQKCNLSSLQFLKLNNNNITDQCVKIFTQQQWPHLFQLTLNDNKITSKGFQYICLNSWPRLRYLQIANNKIGEGESGQSYLQKLYTPNLFYLNINNCNITTTEFLGNLVTNALNFKKLQAKCNNFEKKGHFSFNSIVVPKSQIIQLYLVKSLIGTDFIKNLAKIRVINTLEILDLSQNNITSQSLKYLMKCQMPLLNKLNLQNNYINDSGLRTFNFGIFSRLFTVNLIKNKISFPGIFSLMSKVATRHFMWIKLPLFSHDYMDIITQTDMFYKQMSPE